MVENIREMVPERIGKPDPIVEHVGYVLNRPVVNGQGIEKKIMPKHLEYEDRALEERVFLDEIMVVPKKFTLERRGVGDETCCEQNQEHCPTFVGKSDCESFKTSHEQRLQS
jgi:hypothetical protein